MTLPPPRDQPNTGRPGSISEGDAPSFGFIIAANGPRAGPTPAVVTPTPAVTPAVTPVDSAGRTGPSRWGTGPAPDVVSPRTQTANGRRNRSPSPVIPVPTQPRTLLPTTRTVVAGPTRAVVGEAGPSGVDVVTTIADVPIDNAAATSTDLPPALCTNPSSVDVMAVSDTAEPATALPPTASVDAGDVATTDAVVPTDDSAVPVETDVHTTSDEPGRDTARDPSPAAEREHSPVQSNAGALKSNFSTRPVA